MAYSRDNNSDSEMVAQQNRAKTLVLNARRTIEGALGQDAAFELLGNRTVIDWEYSQVTDPNGNTTLKKMLFPNMEQLSNRGYRGSAYNVGIGTANVTLMGFPPHHENEIEDVILVPYQLQRGSFQNEMENKSFQEDLAESRDIHSVDHVIPCYVIPALQYWYDTSTVKKMIYVVATEIGTTKIQTSRTQTQTTRNTPPPFDPDEDELDGLATS